MATRTSPFLDSALVGLEYIYPATVLIYYLVSCLFSLCSLQKRSPKDENVRRTPILRLLLFSVFTYFGQITVVVVHSAIAGKWLGQQDAVICLLSCVLVFGVQLAYLSDSAKPVWYPYVGSIFLALLFEPFLEVLFVLQQLEAVRTYPVFADVAIVAIRYIALVTAAILYVTAPKAVEKEAHDSEREPLLGGVRAGNQNSEASETTQDSGYGTASSSEDSTDASTSSGDEAESPWERRERESRARLEKSLQEDGNWFNYAKRFLIFFPYIWPVGNKPLQIRAILVIVCLFVNNALNVLIPRQLGIVTDSLSRINQDNPWTQVLIYAALKLAASDAGISLLRQWLWVPVEYYSVGAMSNAAYSHILNLSSDFHDSKSSSDMLMAIQTGQDMTNLLEQICFSAVPMVIDFGIAFVYLSITFGPYEGLITIATALIFICLATRLLSRIKKARKGEVKAWFHEHYVRQAGIQGWPTVVSFNQIEHEEKRHSTAVNDRVAQTKSVWVSYLLAHAFEYLVLLAGLLAGAFLAVYQVTSGRGTPGQFIMLLTYWAQLVGPLNFFARLGKSISQKLIHAEQLLEIMQTKPTVVNSEDAKPLNFQGGQVKFNHVSFAYDDKKQILKDVDLSVEAGLTIALVGSTGAGKSTILKLIDRFYDVTEGSIEIDGQDIRQVDLHSLRAQIGIVPQSPILFDDTIINNVRYARLTATDAEVFEACEAACIHEQILGFSEGYNTRVGERGIKLSGGELQRVAIARAILKRPSIVLLDEATSAVDTETEQKIQAALRTLCHGRTTFMIAHRLSTIMNADRILVLGGGEVIEQGSHEELIRAKGKYAGLWSKQVFIEPSDDESVNQGQGSKDCKTPQIVNDLSPEMTTSELAKVNNSSTSEDKVEERNGDVAELATSSTPLGHQKEGSKLNPDAPTFTPRTFAATLTAAVGDTLATPTKIGALKNDPVTMISESPTTAKAIKHPDTPPTVSIPTIAPGVQRDEEVVAQQPNSKDGTETINTNTSKSKKMKLKYPRYSRRVQSKSEPSSNSNLKET